MPVARPRLQTRQQRRESQKIASRRLSDPPGEKHRDGQDGNKAFGPLDKVHVAAVSSCDRATDSEPEAAARLTRSPCSFASVKGFEDMFALVFGNAGPIIDNFDHRLLVVNPNTDLGAIAIFYGVFEEIAE